VPTTSTAGRAQAARWQGALQLLGAVRQRPGITRAAAARALGLTTGSATEITARLRALALLDERPVPTGARGRPTMALHCSGQGPLVAAVDIRHEGWQMALADLEGVLTPVAAHPHRDRSPEAVLRDVRAVLTAAHRRHGRRLRIVSVAVAGTVQDHQLVQASTLGWTQVDLAALLAGPSAALPLLIGNDATLAGVAEARRAAAADSRAVLHLTAEVGIGGVLVVDGQAVTGATGAGGEFGHLPFGNPALACPCGAHGCWDLEVDGRAMARHLGAPPPRDPRSYAAATLERAPTDPAAAQALQQCAGALGAGAAGLVNALDPDLVTLGGLAAQLHTASPEPMIHAYRAGLMSFRRQAPPPLRPAELGSDGPLTGAAEVGLDHLLTAQSLAEWAGP
jgi:predicted NBD/HSP70 family sugar kinase